MFGNISWFRNQKQLGLKQILDIWNEYNLQKLKNKKMKTKTKINLSKPGLKISYRWYFFYLV